MQAGSRGNGQLPVARSARLERGQCRLQGAQGLVDALSTDMRVQRCAVRKLLVSAWGTLDADDRQDLTQQRATPST